MYLRRVNWRKKVICKFCIILYPSINRRLIYNLDVIISVGYRVKSQRGVRFRQWTNRILKEYLVKGYAVNDRLRRDQLGELRQLVQVSRIPNGIFAL